MKSDVVPFGFGLTPALNARKAEPNFVTLN
jgi:hypothetical protein